LYNDRSQEHRIVEKKKGMKGNGEFDNKEKERRNMKRKYTETRGTN
jgi:hypothetical protein